MALVLLVAGAVVFFLADPLGLPELVLEVADKRASIIAMLASLVFGPIGLWFQPATPPVSVDDPNPVRRRRSDVHRHGEEPAKGFTFVRAGRNMLEQGVAADALRKGAA
ncbi:hypothetical protein ACFQYP_19545 [Nonomuraea antimicrobica]